MVKGIILVVRGTIIAKGDIVEGKESKWLIVVRVVAPLAARAMLAGLLSAAILAGLLPRDVGGACLQGLGAELFGW